MKLKNEQEIEELAKSHRENLYRKWTGNMDREQASDIEDIIIQTYTQAQQDLLDSASIGFIEYAKSRPEYFHRISTLDCDHGLSLWQAAKLSSARELELIKKDHKNEEDCWVITVESRDVQISELQKENEELKSVLKKENRYKFTECDCPPGLSCDCEPNL